MKKTVTAADANRQFSRLLQGVRRGQTYIVTSHGKPVAELVPVGERDEVQSRAQTELIARLRSQPVRNIGRWTRDELYEDA